MSALAPAEGRDVPPERSVQQARLESVREQNKNEPGILKQAWRIVKWPLIIGGLALGAWYGWDYLKKFLEDFSKKQAVETNSIREGSRGAGGIGGVGTTIDGYTRDTTVTGSGGGSVDRSGRINEILPAPTMPPNTNAAPPRTNPQGWSK
ncbi:hypothetical protein HYW84_01385 [Candidatus Peregrinibacteria bacterium]|nr:hypothetical protein [Candidatus Peregrinibacteria bacterium]